MGAGWVNTKHFGAAYRVGVDVDLKSMDYLLGQSRCHLLPPLAVLLAWQRVRPFYARSHDLIFVRYWKQSKSKTLLQFWGRENIILLLRFSQLCCAALTYYLLCHHLPDPVRLIRAPSGIAGAWGAWPPREGGVCWHRRPTTLHSSIWLAPRVNAGEVVFVFFLVQVAQTKANHSCTYDKSNSDSWKQCCDCMADMSPTHCWIGECHVHQVKNLDTEPVLRHSVSWMSFYGNHGTPPWCLHLLPYFHFLQLVTNIQQVWGSFCPFVGQSPCSLSPVRVKPRSGGMAGLGHALPGKSIAGSSLAACGVMVCSPYNCREADWLASASPLLLRCATTGSLEWGPGGWTHSYASPRHLLPWPLSRWTLRYAGWRWGFVPAVSTVEPIFLRKQLSDIWGCARFW